MINRNLWVYDIETLKSCFTYSAINIDTLEKVQFVLHKDKWELEQLLNHLNECKGQVGFNNLNFDYPIIHWILRNNWGTYNYNSTQNRIDFIHLIYQEAQRIIEEQNKPDFNSVVAIKSKDVLIPQLDLFKNGIITMQLGLHL